MARKPKKPANAVTTVTDTEKAKLLAKAALRPSINAAAVMREYARPLGELDVNDLADALLDSINEVNGGNLYRCEAMLMAQAHALQSIFMNLSRRAALNMGEHLGATETYLRLALKAQSQCRTTLEALAEIKNPRPVAFVRQANIAAGHQQINNGTAAPSRAREIQNQQTQLSEGGNELLPDTRASALAGDANSTLEAVGKINRAEVARG